MYQNGRKHVEQLQKVLRSLGLEEKRSVVTKYAKTLRAGCRADDNLLGGKEINRIVTSSKQLPDELAKFYLLRLGDEVQDLV
jgi:tRNA isopentenyl-2-thiomethyl-A-37 hydroxylase MiaE